MRALAIVLCLVCLGCDGGERDRLTHEYLMECLKQHGHMNPWNGYCEVRP